MRPVFGWIAQATKKPRDISCKIDIKMQVWNTRRFLTDFREMGNWTPDFKIQV